MFIRLKKIKGKQYAYLVKNKRKKGKVRQKVVEYIGEALIAGEKEKTDFFDFVGKNIKEYIQDKNLKEIFFDLVRWEIKRHKLENIYFDSENISVMKNSKGIIIKMNEGYLYGKRIKEIINFIAVGDDEYFIGKEFAELFVKAGIDIPKELFVGLFERYHFVN